MKVNVMLVGYGHVGKGFTDMLLAERQRLFDAYGILLSVVGAVDAGGAALCPQGFPLSKLHTVAWDTGSVAHYPEYGRASMSAHSAIAESNAHILVECTPSNFVTAEPAIGHIIQALDLGMDVVLANKGPLALQWNYLHSYAHSKGKSIAYSAAAAAGLEVISLVSALGNAGDIQSVRGVLNATSQFVLHHWLQQGMSQEEALRLAQEQGIAEADAQFDLGGYDSAVKLLLLANAAGAGGLTLNDVHIQGIEAIHPDMLQEAKAHQGHLALLAEAKSNATGSFELSVTPQVLDKDDPLAQLSYHDKAVQVFTHSRGMQLLVGKGMGMDGTAGSVLSDVVRLARSLKLP